MDGKVVFLRGVQPKPPADEQESGPIINETAIGCLETVLEKLRSGELNGVAYAVTMPDGGFGTYWVTGADTAAANAMVCAIIALKRRIENDISADPES